jgi:hypothetical protein
VIIETLISSFRGICELFPDKRTGDNISYGMSDIGLTAFSVFFMQSPSFLANQRLLETGCGKSNCQSLFKIDKIPTDNHIRNMLDPALPSLLFPLFGEAVGLLGCSAANSAWPEYTRAALAHRYIPKLPPGARVAHTHRVNSFCPQAMLPRGQAFIRWP